MKKTEELFKNDVKFCKKYEVDFLAGIDEAGRGPWAGPVVASAVIFPPDPSLIEKLDGLNDSKLLTETKREKLVDLIHENALSVGVSIVEVEEIDRVGIGVATRFAHSRSLQQLDQVPPFVLIDGREEVRLPILQESLIKGDGKSLAIAAASVIAKVTRDKILVELHKEYPDYGFFWHKGYGTKMHQNTLKLFGVSPVHRKSYAPVAECPPPRPFTTEFPLLWDKINNIQGKTLSYFYDCSPLEIECLTQRLKSLKKSRPGK